MKPLPPPPAAALRAQLVPNEPPASVVFSYGLGTDSTAALRYLIEHPEARDFSLDQMVVVTAMVGDEWTQTGLDVQECVLPWLRGHNIRYIQATRAQRKITADGTGIRILDDSRTPRTLHFSGPQIYRLSDEMLAAGTLPQLGGSRLCSVHAKGDVLDPIIAAVTGGRPYQHLIGFESTEASRALKDSRFNTSLRTGTYPLIDWGWDRTAATEYLLEQTGRIWTKSACVFCPFALSSATGRAATLPKYAAHPAAGARMLWLEHVALAMNPKQGLIGVGKRAIDHIAAAGLHEVLAQFHGALETSEHAVYEVRRVTLPAVDPAKKGKRWRSVRPRAYGSRPEMLAWLTDLPGRSEHGSDGITRRILRDGLDPATGHAEHYYVAAPAGVENKQRPGFEKLWRSWGLPPSPTTALNSQLDELDLRVPAQMPALTLL